MKFTVVISPTSIHTQCFAELATSITWALTQLGHDAFRDTSVRPGTRGIVFGARAGDSFPPDAILYNGEQINKDGMWPQLVELYSKHTVWDYSTANAKRYSDWGLKLPEVVRPGFCPVLVGRIPKRPIIYDVVFFGSVNDRRRKILDDLKAKSMSVLEVPFGVYGKERDELLAQAALCINIHYYESSIFEAVRCSYLAMNNIHVLSERSVDDEGEAWGMPGVAYEDLVQSAYDYVAMDAREGMARTQRNMVEGVSLLNDVHWATLALEQQNREWAQKLGADLAAAGEAEHATPGVMEAGIPYIGPQLTLTMIVKDEAHIIERCLASVKPIISRWCIVDTGSTDGTQEVIRKYLADVPGSLHELPWREFDGSRTDAINLARKECNDEGWLLFIDADEQLQLKGKLVLEPGFDCFLGWVHYGGNPWGREVLARANKRWFYDMPRHEGLYCHDHAPAYWKPLDSLWILSGTDSARRGGDEYEKFMNDARVLEQYLIKHPKSTRCCFYLAQSYRDAANAKQPMDRAAMQKALLMYLRRSDMPNGFDQETFSAMFDAGKCMTKLDYPAERVVGQLLRAFNFRPSRMESLHALAVHFRENDQWALAELMAHQAATATCPPDTFTDLDPGVYNWKAKDEWACALTWLNRCAEAKVLYEELLQRQDLPIHEYTRIVENLAHCQRRLAENRGFG